MLFIMLLVVAVSSMLASSLPIAAFAATFPVTAAIALDFAAARHAARLYPRHHGGDRAGLFRRAGLSALFDHAGDAGSARGKRRADRRTRTGQDDFRRSAPARRSRQYFQVALSRADEPRTAHAAQRHSRIFRSDEDGSVRRTYGGGLQGIFRRHSYLGRASARADQRNSRSVAHRGRALRIERGVGVAGRHRRGLPSSAEAARHQPRHHHARSLRARTAAAVGGRARAAPDLRSICCRTRSSSRRKAARSGSRSAGPPRAANT